MTQPTPEEQQPQQPSEEQPGSTAGPVTVAIGLAALAAGLPDPWLPARLRRFAALVRVERILHSAYTQVVDDWLDSARRRVVNTTYGTVDTNAILQTETAFTHRVQVEVIDKAVKEVWHDAYLQAGGWEPDGLYQVRRYLDTVTNRMTGTPDSTFAAIRKAVTKGAEQGDPMDDVAREIQRIMDQDEVTSWRNRAMTVARTETVAAYNAGTLAGWHSYAKQVGAPFEKMWLATEDHRTRPTHRIADGQRVPLGLPFSVGDASLDHPGAIGPVSLPEEVINCRCSMLLLKPGEHADLSNRHYREGP